MLQKIPISGLLPYGYLCVWANVDELHHVWRHVRGLGFRFVESVAWIFTQGGVHDVVDGSDVSMDDVRQEDDDVRLEVDDVK